MKKILLLSFLCFGTLSINAQDYPDHTHELIIGSENLAQTNRINGGNYLHLGYNLRLFNQLSLTSKIASDVVPKTFDDVFLSAGTQWNSKLNEKGFHQTVGVFYMKNINNEKSHGDFFGCRVSLINQVLKDGKYGMEFLPVYLYYNPNDERLSIGFEYLSFRVLF